MPNRPIALQLYSVRHDLDRDLRGTLKAVADMGYDGVEFAGPPKHSASELRGLLDAFGLACCGWHVPFNLVQDDVLSDTIAFHKAVGNHRLVVPGIPEKLRQSREDWLKLADFFNALAVKLGKCDLVTGYHNHHVEFSPLSGEAPWDTFFGHTDARVIMQLDTGNALYGGGKILDILSRYPGRANTVHLKPYDSRAAQTDPKAAFRPVIGADDTPWNEVFRLCETSGATEWYIVEYESDAYEPLDAVNRCLKGIQAL